jgi:hypothetical protein
VKETRITVYGMAQKEEVRAHRRSCDRNDIGRAIEIPAFMNAEVGCHPVVNDMEWVWASVRICVQLNSTNGSFESRARRSPVQIGSEIRSLGTCKCVAKRFCGS